MKRKKSLGTLLLFALCLDAGAIDNRGITFSQLASDRFTLVENGTPNAILIDEQEDTGVMIAAKNLQNDFERVTGKAADLLFEPGVKRVVIVGTLKSHYIKELVKAKKIDASLLNGKNEKYLMTVVPAPLKGVEEALVIAGSDKRGTIYGIYELSEQIGVSPWYDWADVPVVPQQNLSIVRGSYTAGEPAVKYRGIFLNDEAPCLTGWVKHTYGTNYGDHRFYARVFELILRLRGNFMWPAMWGWSFYADDPENSKTANDMGVIMGTSHHEPMARNHQEWARKRKEYGAWDYASNQKVIDRFFREGIERAVDTEDLITIGMRGDGDTPMGGKEGEDDKYVSRDKENMRLMEKIFKNQRRIIKEVTGKAPEKRPQVLECDVVRFQNNKEKWVAFVGLLNGYPYEIFTGIQDDDEGIVLPKSVMKGRIIKNTDEDGNKRYDFQFENKKGYKTTVEGLSEKFNKEYWNYAKLISGVLRYRMPLEHVIKLVGSLQLESESINTWKNGVERALKKYITDGTEAKGMKCPNCGHESLVYQEGCLICKHCGASRCG